MNVFMKRLKGLPIDDDNEFIESTYRKMVKPPQVKKMVSAKSQKAYRKRDIKREEKE